VGLITQLLTLPLAPVRGIAWISEQLVNTAESEFYDRDAIYAQLRELSSQLDEGWISEDEFEAVEDELLQRLEQARNRDHGI
jgi:hypothetical protein